MLEQEAWESEKLDCAGRLGDSFSLTISHIENRANDTKEEGVVSRLVYSSFIFPVLPFSIISFMCFFIYLFNKSVLDNYSDPDIKDKG